MKNLKIAKQSKYDFKAWEYFVRKTRQKKNFHGIKPTNPKKLFRKEGSSGGGFFFAKTSIFSRRPLTKPAQKASFLRSPKARNFRHRYLPLGESLSKNRVFHPPGEHPPNAGFAHLAQVLVGWLVVTVLSQEPPGLTLKIGIHTTGPRRNTAVLRTGLAQDFLHFT